VQVEILERLPGTDRVRFRSVGGEAVARWADADPPTGGTFAVEVDVPGALDWTDIGLPAGAEPGLRQDGDRTTITGTVEGLDELGVLTVRIPDGHVLLDTTGEAPTEIVGRTVRLTVPDLELSPYSVGPPRISPSSACDRRRPAAHRRRTVIMCPGSRR
jgi:hypothetical protein